MNDFNIVKKTGWLLTPKLGAADEWYVVEIPGGYQQGHPFPENAVWREFPNEQEARDFILNRPGLTDATK